LRGDEPNASKRFRSASSSNVSPFMSIIRFSLGSESSVIGENLTDLLTDECGDVKEGDDSLADTYELSSLRLLSGGVPESVHVPDPEVLELRPGVFSEAAAGL